MSRTNKIFQNYFGSKNGSGVYHQIINQIRPHTIYMELFAGSGAIAQFKKDASKATLINDKDEAVYKEWIRSSIDISNCVISNHNAIDLLSKYEFLPTEKYVIYLDPPYPMLSRRSDKKVYRHEMTDQEHVELLNAVVRINSKHENVDFLISTYKNPIYELVLFDWQLHTFQAQTRKGLATEYLYMNYINAGELHQYDYLGTNYIDRQRIKRKVDCLISKLKNLPASERNAIIQAVSDIA